MNPETLFGDIEQYVSDSRALLKEGAMMELAGLENRVMLLCEEILLLSQDDRLQHADRLQRLMADLTALGEEIAAQRDAVGKELRNLPGHKKAHAAYKIVEKSDEEDK